jgi:hypothetical protein
MDNSICHNLAYLVPALKVSGIRSKVPMTIVTGFSSNCLFALLNIEICIS